MSATHPSRSTRHRTLAVAYAAYLLTAYASGTASGFPPQDEPEPPTAEVAPTAETPADAPAPAKEANDTHGGNELSDLSLEELMEVQVVVSASRHEQPVKSLPYAISVITARDIHAAGARSVPDALRLAAGVDVADLAYAQAAVSPRGFHGFLSRSVLVLVDGRQIFDSLFGGTVWGARPFQLEDIERIEVIRGPGGVTWGANAVNGVINIILKKPVDQLGTTLTLGGASLGTHKEHIGYGLQDGPVTLHVSAEFEGSDGFRRPGLSLAAMDDDYKAARVGVRAVYDYGPMDRLELSAGSGVTDGGLPRTPLLGLGLRRNAGTQASYLMARWTHTPQAGEQTELTAYVNDFQASPGAPQTDYRYQQISLQLRHTLQPSDTHTFTWGVDTRTDLLDASNSDPQMLSRGFVSTAIIGLYAQDDWHFAPKWSLGLGVRGDYEFYGGFQPSARASLSHEFDDGATGYAAVSRAFQMAPVGLRFLEMPLINGLVYTTGERDLDVESVISYEVGYRRKLFGHVDANINAFWAEHSDLTALAPKLGPPGLARLALDRHADASLHGVEIETRYPVTKKLTLLGTYTYEELDWRSSEVAVRDKDVMTPPRHKAMLGVRFDPTDRLHLASHLYYVDAVKAPDAFYPFASRRIDAYLRWDLRAEYEFSGEDACLSVGVRNLLDGGHPEGGTLFLNAGESQRMVFAEFRLRIKPR